MTGKTNGDYVLFSIPVPVRLGFHGHSEAEGYVEALGMNYEWGGICNQTLNNFEEDKDEANVICQMLGYESALDVGIHYSVSPPKANYFGDLWIFNDLECSLGTNVSSVFDCYHNEEWEGVCSTDQIAGVKCHQSKLF